MWLKFGKQINTIWPNRHFRLNASVLWYASRLHYQWHRSKICCHNTESFLKNQIFWLSYPQLISQNFSDHLPWKWSLVGSWYAAHINMNLYLLNEISALQKLTFTVDIQNVSLLLLNKLKPPEKLFDTSLCSLTSVDVIVLQVLCLISSSAWGLFEYPFFFQGFLTAKNHTLIYRSQLIVCYYFCSSNVTLHQSSDPEGVL
jgi:hypothetical protein